MSRLVEKLRLSGFVERVPHSGDRRMVVVTISDTGKQLLGDIDQTQFTNHESGPGRKLTESEAVTLAELLDKFRD